MKIVLLVVFLLSNLVSPIYVFAECINPASAFFDEDSNQYWEILDSNQSGLDVTGDMTISMFIKLESESEKELLSKWNHASQTSYLLTTTGTNLQFYINSSPSGYGYKSVFVPHGKSLGEWFQLTVVYDAENGSAEFFVEGILVGSGGGLPSNIADTGAPFRIGAYATPNEYFDGNVDDVRIWSRSLVPSEIELLSSNPSSFYNGSNLEAYWKFDNNGNDSSLNNNDLTGFNGLGFSNDVAFGVCDEPEENTYPLYTQIESPYPSAEDTAAWAGDKFARGDGVSAFSNCPTIASCGCTITSTVMLARSYGVALGIDGTDVNPGNFNQWLIRNDGYDSAGNLEFAQAIKYFGVEENGVKKSYFEFDDDRLSEAEVKSRVSDGVPTVSKMTARNGDGTIIPTHFVLVTELLSSEYRVNDPLWYNTVTLDDVKTLSYQQDYNNIITSGRDLTFVEEPVLVASRLEASLLTVLDASDSVTTTLDSQALNIEVASSVDHETAPAEMYLVTPDGGKVGINPVTGDEFDVEDGQYWEEGFLQDPLSDEGVYDYGVTKMLSVSHLLQGAHKVFVVGTGAGTYEFSGLVHDKFGKEHMFSFTAETDLGVIDVYEFDVETGEVVLVPVDIDLLTAIIDNEIDGEILNRFFKYWANKIFSEIEEGKIEQATKHIETFRKLIVARRVESLALITTLEKMLEELEG